MLGSKGARLASRLVIVGALALSTLGLAGAGTASAAGLETCTTTAAVHSTYLGPTVVWSLAGRGSCVGDGNGSFFIDYTGSGTSTGHGLCTTDDPTVTDLNINVAGTLTRTDTLATKPLIQRWAAPVTTFPVTTPFLVHADGGKIGDGAVFTHLFLACPPGGSDVATVVWSFTL